MERARHALTGVGLEGFAAHYPAYREPEEARLSLRREVTFPHNLPLSVFAEAGVVGLLLLGVFLVVPLGEPPNLGLVLDQDSELLPVVQEGQRSMGFDGPLWGEQEQRLRHFHVELDRYLNSEK